MLSSKKMDRPEISQFENYRAYLKALFAHRKSFSKHFSHQLLARKTRTNTSYFKHVFDERRHISLDKISIISKAFELTPPELRIFTVMVVRELVTDLETREYFAEVLAALQSQTTNLAGFIKQSEGKFVVSSVLTDWLSTAIAEMSRFKDFKNSITWIKHRLIDGEKITEKEIRLALDKNETQGHSGEKSYYLANAFTPESFLSFRPAFEKTWEVLGDPARYRACQFTVGTFAVNSEDQKRIFQLFTKFRDEALEIGAKSRNPVALLSLTGGLFNLTKEPGDSCS
jgi:hypothetical protein